MQKSFLFNALFVLLINVLIKPLYLFGIDRNVQIITGESYGLFYTFFSLAFILSIIADLGIQNFNLRFSSQSLESIPKNFQKFLSIKLILAIAYFSVYLMVGWVTGYLADHFELFLLVGVSLWLNSFLLFIRSFIAARGWYTIDSALSIVDKTIMIVLIGFLLLSVSWRPFLSIMTFVQIQVLAYCITILIGVLFLVRMHCKFLPKWEPQFLIVILRQSFPYAMVIFLMLIYVRTDTVMLAWIDPLKTVAVDAYAESFRILEALNMMGFLLSSLLLPMFSKIYKKANSPADLFYQGFGISAAIAVPVAISAYTYAPNLMEALYHHNDGYPILKWHLITFVMYTFSYLFGTLITAAGKIAQLNWFFVLAGVLNIGLNFLVIPEWGAKGAAMTSAITQLFVLCVQGFYAYERLKLRFILRKWAVLLLFIALTIILNIAGTSMDLQWWLKFILFTVIGGVMAILFRVLDLRAAIILLRTKIKS